MTAWRTITAETYVNNSDPEGFDEARMMCPDGRMREIWDAGFDEGGDAVIIHTAQANEFAVTPGTSIQVR